MIISKKYVQIIKIVIIMVSVIKDILDVYAIPIIGESKLIILSFII